MDVPKHPTAKEWREAEEEMDNAAKWPAMAQSDAVGLIEAARAGQDDDVWRHLGLMADGGGVRADRTSEPFGAEYLAHVIVELLKILVPPTRQDNRREE